MADRLHWNTVKPILKEVLTKLMQEKLFEPFRLVGGTSLSLQLGHRMSDDIDLFTEEPYDSLDFAAIDKFLRKTFKYVSDLAPGPVAIGVSYLIGHLKNESVKLDLFYTDTFIQPVLQVGPYRLATVEEIIAMKIDIIQRKARKKDFWDLDELLDKYPIEQMIALHKQRYPDSHDEKVIRENFVDFQRAEEDFTPICLKGKHWELIKLDFVERVRLL
jgi:predicted nucleotidyltransferase component of viral defense system